MGDLSKNFSRHEFACRCGCGQDTVDHELIERAQDLCDESLKMYPPGSYLVAHVTSGNRCETHNKDEGGADDSQHRYSKALDAVFEIVKPDGHRVIVPPDPIKSIVDKNWPAKYGFAMYRKGRFHFDVAARFWRKDYR